MAGTVPMPSVAVTVPGLLGAGLGTWGTLCQEQLVTYQAKKKPLSSIHGYELTLLSAPPLPSPSLSFIDSLKSGAGTAESTPVASSLTL